MNSFRRNLLVGLTILGALVMLGWFALEFGKVVASPFAQRQMPVQFVADRADGLSNGSPVTFHGVEVGHIEDVHLGQGNVTVLIDAMIDESPPLPGNIVGEVRTVGALGGSALLALELNGRAPQGLLQRGAKLPARFVGSDLLPAELSNELTKATRELNSSHLFVDLDTQVRSAGHLVDSMNKLVGDQQVRSNVKESLVNVRLATTRAVVITERLDRFTAQLDDVSRSTLARLAQVGQLLQDVQSITGKIDRGVGTAGAFVNDPQLYQSLAASAQELNLAIKDLKRLVEQWEQEGVSLHLH
jgi:phospholipid/cholesterol/gamma-HCH transport system substrate-binding protein